MKIRKIGDRSPTPNQRMAIGIHAIGEIGRSIWKIGLSVRYAPPTQPIQRPSGTATRNASPKPTPTRDSDAPMCCHKVPSRASSHAPVTTCHGVGKMALSFFTTTIHQIAIRSMTTIIGGTIFVSVALLTLTGFPLLIPFSLSCGLPHRLAQLSQTPTQRFPSARRSRLDDHLELP